MSDSFPRILKMLRKEKHISQREAAQQLGVSQALLSHYEKGIRECKLDFVVRVADYYNVSCDYLLGRSPDKNGAQITVEDIPDPEKTVDKKLRNSIMPTLNKKLLSNSLNILYDWLAKCNNKHLTSEVSSYLMLAVYKMFRILYSSNSKNPTEMFSAPNELWDGMSDSAMTMAKANVQMLSMGKSYGKLEGVDNADSFEATAESLATEYSLYSTSLTNVIQNAETKMGISKK